MPKIFFSVLIILLPLFSVCQPLSYYVNLQNQVMVWDKGLIRKIDYLQPLEVKTGRVAIPYIDNARSFKIYYGGAMKKINAGFTNEFKISDNLVAYKNNTALSVFDKGKIKQLSTYCDTYYLGDSVLLYFDGVRSEYKAYYNGEVYPIEGFLASDALDVVKVTDNIAAYVNYANQFRIFYGGQILSQEDYAVNSFEVGRSTVGYIDISRRFKIFHDGETYIVEDFPPNSYQVGDNVVAYVSTDGYFKVFYDNSIESIGFFEPQDYRVIDNMVAFRDQSGYMKVFYRGKVYSLESYYPDKFVMQYHSIAYVNRMGMLRLFSYGELYDVTNATLEDWQLTYDVLKYQIGKNMYRIYYKGMEYAD
ncbi:MAG: hypothetical protein KDC07_00960 [Chitinophagaceae bacterium]|nr:hypothetical protein [Chitinophagaceae bacterium]MCB9045811.1 hypothetical protein [Chitinophagales bacterium]